MHDKRNKQINKFLIKISFYGTSVFYFKVVNYGMPLLKQKMFFQDKKDLTPLFVKKINFNSENNTEIFNS